MQQIRIGMRSSISHRKDQYCKYVIHSICRAPSPLPPFGAFPVALEEPITTLPHTVFPTLNATGGYAPPYRPDSRASSCFSPMPTRDHQQDVHEEQIAIINQVSLQIRYSTQIPVFDNGNSFILNECVWPANQNSTQHSVVVGVIIAKYTHRIIDILVVCVFCCRDIYQKWCGSMPILVTMTYILVACLAQLTQHTATADPIILHDTHLSRFIKTIYICLRNVSFVEPSQRLQPTQQKKKIQKKRRMDLPIDETQQMYFHLLFVCVCICFQFGARLIQFFFWFDANKNGWSDGKYLLLLLFAVYFE